MCKLYVYVIYAYEYVNRHLRLSREHGNAL